MEFVIWNLITSMSSISPHNLYTTQEAQDFLRVSKSTLKRYLKKGIIKAYKVGGRYKIWGKELLQLVSPEVEEKGKSFYQRTKKKIKGRIQNW